MADCLVNGEEQNMYRVNLCVFSFELTLAMAYQARAPREGFPRKDRKDYQATLRQAAARTSPYFMLRVAALS